MYNQVTYLVVAPTDGQFLNTSLQDEYQVNHHQTYEHKNPANHRILSSTYIENIISHYSHYFTK